MAKEKNDTPAQSSASATPSQSSLISEGPSPNATVTATSSQSSPTPTEAGFREMVRQYEEKKKQLDERERQLDSKDAHAMLSAPVTGAAGDDSAPTITVLNNAAFAIGLYNGTPLKPGINTVHRSAWERFFQKDGRAIPGARTHFEPPNGGRPDLQLVSLDNLPALPDEHALTAVSASSDATRLGLFAQTETRATVKDAINARLKAIQGEKK